MKYLLLLLFFHFNYLFLTGDYTITVSHLEIYQEELNDLLSPHNEVRFMYISFQDSSSLVVVVLLLFLAYILSDNLKQMFFTNRLFSLSRALSRVLSRALSPALSRALSLSRSLFNHKAESLTARLSKRKFTTSLALAQAMQRKGIAMTYDPKANQAMAIEALRQGRVFGPMGAKIFFFPSFFFLFFFHQLLFCQLFSNSHFSLFCFFFLSLFF